MKRPKNYIFSADVIRALAILAVVAIHTTNSVFERPDFFGGKSWWVAIIINSISRICIPLFIMLSGFLLFRKDENYFTTIKKVVNRLLVPLFFWTILVYVFGNPNSYTDLLNPYFYLRFFSGNVYAFYFLVILTGLYLVSPLFKSFIKSSSDFSQKKLAYALIFSGVAQAAVEYLARDCSTENSFTKWFPFAGIFLMGYLIASGKLKFKNSLLLKAIYFIGLAATIVFNYWYYSKGSVKVLRTNPTDCLTHYSDYYLSINVVMMTIPAFAILFNGGYKWLQKNFLSKIIYNISRASYGIYLTHLIFVSIWDGNLKWTVDNTTLPLWLFVIVKWFGIFTVSYVASVLISKIPVVKRLIGESDS